MGATGALVAQWCPGCCGGHAADADMLAVSEYAGGSGHMAVSFSQLCALGAAA